MLRTNIRNLVRQTQLPKWKPLLPLFEAVMNSFQAIRDAKRKQGGGRIRIQIGREASLLPDEVAPVRSFTITDDGIGLSLRQTMRIPRQTGRVTTDSRRRSGSTMRSAATTSCCRTHAGD